MQVFEANILITTWYNTVAIQLHAVHTAAN